MLGILLFVPVIATWIYWLIACWLVHAFFRVAPACTDFAPPISILKPVKGLDAEAELNFRSFCQQDYPQFELLFGVADADDLAIPVIRRLQSEFPAKVRLLITPATHANRKASLLHQLVAHAQYDTLVASDSDMRVTPDYLRRVVAPLADERVGLVTCLYRGRSPVTLTARLEALHMGVTHLPSVLVGRLALDMRFALGASVTLRRRDLARIGGFGSIAGYLADDYQLGARIADTGLRVYLSDYVVDSILGATSFWEQWDREVRWAQCSRVSRPAEYPGLLLTFSTPLALLYALLTGFRPLGCAALASSLLLRWLVAWQITADTDNRLIRRWLFWLPVRDLFSALVWCAGTVSRRVVWRGETYVLEPGGRLRPVQASARRAAERVVAGLGRRIIFGIDTLLRRLYGIQTFCHHPECILRIAMTESKGALVLSDGTHIVPGEKIGSIHLWNEMVPRIPKDGPDMTWARAFVRQMHFSLSQLAAFVQEEPAYKDVRAFYGANLFMSQYDRDVARRILERWGFDIFVSDGSPGLWVRLVRFLSGLYVKALVWAFNPASLQKGKRWNTRPNELWISRDRLLAQYGPAPKVRTGAHTAVMPARTSVLSAPRCGQ